MAEEPCAYLMEWHGAPVADEEGANLVVRRSRRNSGLGHRVLALILTDPRTMPTAACSVLPQDRPAAARLVHRAGDREIRRKGALDQKQARRDDPLHRGQPRPARGSLSRSPR